MAENNKGRRSRIRVRDANGREGSVYYTSYISSPYRFAKTYPGSQILVTGNDGKQRWVNAGKDEVEGRIGNQHRLNFLEDAAAAPKKTTQAATNAPAAKPRGTVAAQPKTAATPTTKPTAAAPKTTAAAPKQTAPGNLFGGLGDAMMNKGREILGQVSKGVNEAEKQGKLKPQAKAQRGEREDARGRKRTQEEVNTGANAGANAVVTAPAARTNWMGEIGWDNAREKYERGRTEERLDAAAKTGVVPWKEEGLRRAEDVLTGVPGANLGRSVKQPVEGDYKPVQGGGDAEMSEAARRVIDADLEADRGAGRRPSEQAQQMARNVVIAEAKEYKKRDDASKIVRDMNLSGVVDDVMKEGKRRSTDMTKGSGAKVALSGAGNPMGALIAGARESFGEVSPEQLQADLENKLTENIEGYLTSKKGEITAAAEKLGMDIEDYFQEYIAPQIKEQASGILHDKQVEALIPKTRAEAMLNAITNNVTGSMLKLAVTTKGQRELAGEAQSRNAQGEGYQMGPWESGTSMALSLLSDPIPLKGGGVIGEKVAAASVGRLAAAKGAARMANGTVGQRLFVGVGQSALAGGINLGFYDGFSSVLGAAASGEEMSLGDAESKFITGYGHGAIMGSTLGVTARLWGNATMRIGRTNVGWKTAFSNAAKRAAVGFGGKVVETGGFVLADAITNWETPTMTSTLDAAATVIALGLINGKTPMKVWEGVRHPVKSLLSLENPTPEMRLALDDDVRKELAGEDNKLSFQRIDEALKLMLQKKEAQDNNTWNEYGSELKKAWDDVVGRLSWDAQNQLGRYLFGVQAVERPRMFGVRREGNTVYEVDMVGNVLSVFKSDDVAERATWIWNKETMQERDDMTRAWRDAQAKLWKDLLDMDPASDEFAGLVDDFLNENEGAKYDKMAAMDMDEVARELNDENSELGRDFRQWLLGTRGLMNDPTISNLRLGETEIGWLMSADPNRMDEADRSNMRAIRERCEEIIFGKGEHVAWSKEKGADAGKASVDAVEAGGASAEPIHTEKMYVDAHEESKRKLSEYLATDGEVSQVLDGILFANEDADARGNLDLWMDAYQSLRSLGYTEERLAPIVEYMNSRGMLEGFRQGREMAIDEKVSNWGERVKYTGGDEEVEEVHVCVDGDGNTWYIKGGNYTVSPNGSVRPDEVGVVLVNENGEVKVNADGVKLVGKFGLEDAKDKYRKGLEEGVAAAEPQPAENQAESGSNPPKEENDDNPPKEEGGENPPTDNPPVDNPPKNNPPVDNPPLSYDKEAYNEAMGLLKDKATRKVFFGFYPYGSSDPKEKEGWHRALKDYVIGLDKEAKDELLELGKQIGSQYLYPLFELIETTWRDHNRNVDNPPIDNPPIDNPPVEEGLKVGSRVKSKDGTIWQVMQPENGKSTLAPLDARGVPDVYKRVTEEEWNKRESKIGQQTERQARFANERIKGGKDKLVTPTGQQVAGHYYLAEAETLTPSHDPFKGFSQTEGFPTKDGKTINDRVEYEDPIVQNDTRKKAQNYDQRAISDMVVAWDDGSIMSGNDRTMAGQLAAKNGTDGVYLDYLKEQAARFGFTPEQVASMQHPRVVFVPDEAMPRTTETMAMWNKPREKQQGWKQAAIKASKILRERNDIQRQISEIMYGVDNLSELYRSAERVNKLLQTLMEADMLTSEMRSEWVGEDGMLSDIGKERFETILLGSVFGEDTIKLLSDPNAKIGDVRKNVAYAIVPLIKNGRMKGYSILTELERAIDLICKAKAEGTDLAHYMLQMDLFGDRLATTSLASLMLADLVQSGPRKFKGTMEDLNGLFEKGATGQTDFYYQDMSRDGLLRDVLRDKKYDVDKIIKTYERRQGANTAAETGGDLPSVEKGNGEGEARGSTEGENGGVKPHQELSADPLETAGRIAREDKAAAQPQPAEKGEEGALDAARKKARAMVRVLARKIRRAGMEVVTDWREAQRVLAEAGYGDMKMMQGFGSAATSLNQIPQGTKKIEWKSGTTNVDIGGGKFDKATEFLKEKGVENLVFDPFNRNAEHNKAVAERVRDNKADTSTCHNVLNVIDSEESRANVILQAAKAIKPDGTAYFTVYEGNKSGIGRQTKSDSWQNNRPTKDYVSEIERYFDDVKVKNGVIVAKSPKATAEKSVWDFDGEYKGNDIRFFRTKNGEVYGFAYKGKVYLDERIAGTDTPIHEYTHLWSEALKQRDKGAWEKVVDLMKKQKELWDDVKKTYHWLDNDEDIADEVLAHYSGQKGKERLDAMMEKVDKGDAAGYAQVIATIDGVKRVLNNFWRKVANMLGMRWTSAERVADAVMGDLMKEENLGEDERGQERTGEDARMQEVERKGVFYSNAAKAVHDIKQGKATGAQWLAMVQKNGGLKAAEDKWLGLSDWLNERKGEKISKEDVLQFIRENQVQVQEASYSEIIDIDNNPRMKELREEFNKLAYEAAQKRGKGVLDVLTNFKDKMHEAHGDGWYYKMTPEEQEEYARLSEASNQDTNPFVTAFRQMVDKYGDDFDMSFEIRNGRLEPTTDNGWVIPESAEHFLGIEDIDINETRLAYTTMGLDNKKEIALTVPNIEPWNEGDEIHFGDAGGGRAVAWIRFGDTIDKDGNLVLVIDEIQSKRHQEGREKGYVTNKNKDEIETLKKERERLVTEQLHKNGIAIDAEDVDVYSPDADALDEAYDGTWDMGDRDVMERIKEINTRLNEIDTENPFAVPDAPFEKNWHELAMKRMLRYAAENGYDKIAWTKGEQQAERYSLSDVISEITVSKHHNGLTGERVEGMYGVFPKDKNGSTIIRPDLDKPFSGEMTKEQIIEAYGKDLGNRMIEAAEASDDAATISGEGLVIGGEGMKGFYDQMLPRFMDKYGKKWGVKTGEVELPEVEKAGRKMWSVDVTPEMRESVMQGQPMFQLAKGKEGAATAEPSLAEKPASEGVMMREGEQREERREVSRKAWEEMAFRRERLDRQIKDAGKRLVELTWGSDEWNRVFDERAKLIEERKTVEQELASVTPRQTAAERKQSEEFAQRQWRRAHERGEELVKKLGLGDTVTMVDSIDELDGAERFSERQRNAKGWYDPETGKIVVVMGNHSNPDDVVKTILREGVAHHGLRKLFGEKFDTFLDNVYNESETDIADEINSIASQKGYDTRRATEEYLARLAEDTEFERVNVSWWEKVKNWFVDMFKDLGDSDAHWGTMTDNELRYVLWRSYKNLEEPGARKNVFAEEQAMQEKLQVGDFEVRGDSPAAEPQGTVAAERVNDGRRTTAGEDMSKDERKMMFQVAMPGGGPRNPYTPLSEDAKRSRYEGAFKRASYWWHEAYVDGLKAVEEIMKAMTGKKSVSEILDAHNVYWKLQHLSSVVHERQEKMQRDHVEPLQKSLDEAIRRVAAHFSGKRKKVLGAEEKHEAFEEVKSLLWMKSGMERNRVLYVRDLKGVKIPDDPTKLPQYAQSLYQTLHAATDWTKYPTPEEKAAKEAELRKQAFDGYYDDMYERWKAERARLLGEYESGAIGLRDYYKGMDDFIKQEASECHKRYEADKKGSDYSGLNQVDGGFTNGKWNINAVLDNIELMEAVIGKPTVDAIWNEIRAISKETLEAEYKSSLVSRSQHKHVSEMMDWYLPMRKWNEDMAEDHYSYITGGRGKEPLRLVRANGRWSMPDDPLAWLLQQADAGILYGESNNAKLAFLRLAESTGDFGRGDLVSRSKVWEVLDGHDLNGDPIWRTVWPETSGDMSADKVADIVEQFNADMKAKEEAGEARISRRPLSLDWRNEKQRHKNEHMVQVMLNGQPTLLYVNGNPRAAQAINGLLQARATSTFTQRWGSMNRFISASYTSWSPKFMLRNTFRDRSFAGWNVFAKEGAGYYGRFMKNWLSTLPLVHGLNSLRKTKHFSSGSMRSLWKAYENGTLDMNDKKHRYFSEWRENGGITGYVSDQAIDRYKESLDQALTISDKRKAAKATWKAIFGALSGFNQYAENMARFSAYCTSRDMGRSILRSVADAKDASTNFNRKGAGGSTSIDAKSKSQSWAGTTAEFMRHAYIFMNPSIQSLSILKHRFKEHPARAALGMFTHFALSAAWPVFAGWLAQELHEKLGGDPNDPECDYGNIPEWDRRSGICLYAGKGVWVKLPIGIEPAAAWGLGQIFGSWFLPGQEDMKSATPPVMDVMSTLTALSPIDPLQNDGKSLLVAVAPTLTQPAVQMMSNMKWTGAPIEKDAKWANPAAPRWTRAFSSTPKFYVDVCKMLTWLTNGGNNVEAEKGLIDVSPGMMQTALKGYFGGPVDFLGDVGSVMLKDLSPKTIPVLNGILTQTGLEQKGLKANAQYYKAKKKIDEVEYKLKVYSKDNADPSDTSRKIALENDWSSIIEDWKTDEKEIKRLDKIAKDPSSDYEAEMARAEAFELKAKAAKRVLEK